MKQKIKILNQVFIWLLATLAAGNAFSQLQIAQGTTFVTRGNVNIVLDNMDYNNFGSVDGNASVLHFTGANNNNLFGGTSNGVGILRINKAAGKQVIVTSPLLVTSQLNFISGNLELNNQSIVLGNTGQLTGESETAHVTANNGGFISANAVLNNPNLVNIGNLGAVITSSQNLGLVSIIRRHRPQTLPSPVAAAILRSFEITAASAGTNTTLQFNYFDTELNGNTENALTQFRSFNGSAFSNNSFTTRNTVTNFVTKIGYTNVNGIYTLGNGGEGGPLPVKLISFTAQCKNDFISLNWKTATEQNSDRFDIQRSDNGTSWQKIGNIKSAGNSSNIVSYQYDDVTLNTATAYYRLAQYDLDGRVNFSDIVKAGCSPAKEFKVQPNPANDVAKVIIGASTCGKARLILYNAAGQQLLQQSVLLVIGTNQFPLNTSALAKGTYHLLLMQNGEVNQNIKIIKQ